MLTLTQDDPIRAKPLWTEVVETKRAIRSQHIEKHRHDVENSENDARITGNPDISALTQLLESKQVSAEDIITAYIQKYVEIIM
jgi:hypothetical protein